MLYLSGVVRPDLPAMLSLWMGNVVPADQPWAADNGRFAAPEKYTDARYLRWLGRHAHAKDRCLFATAPDVVGNAGATLALAAPMYARIRAAGYRPALVAQNGLEHLREFIPWGAFDALFIGGTTAWKLSPEAAALVAEAKRRGKWTHMGRVNSLRRLVYADAIGCDSADGTCLKFGASCDVKGWVQYIATHPSLWTSKSDLGGYAAPEETT